MSELQILSCVIVFLLSAVIGFAGAKALLDKAFGHIDRTFDGDDDD